jgi:hypothetical protein
VEGSGASYSEVRERGSASQRRGGISSEVRRGVARRRGEGDDFFDRPGSRRPPRDWLPPCRVGSCFAPSPSIRSKGVLLDLMLMALLADCSVICWASHSLIFEFEF